MRTISQHLVTAVGWPAPSQAPDVPLPHSAPFPGHCQPLARAPHPCKAPSPTLCTHRAGAPWLGVAGSSASLALGPLRAGDLSRPTAPAQTSSGTVPLKPLEEVTAFPPPSALVVRTWPC